MPANIQRAVISVTLAVTMFLIAAGDASGWSNGGYSADPDNPDYGTHDWIADAALQPQMKDVTFLRTTYNSLFILGTEAPDNPSYIGDTGKHHLYYRSDGTAQDNASAVRAASIYNSALQYLNSNEMDYAAFEIGVMAHYISDVGVFGHTMGSGTDWGSEVHHSDYENGFESRLGSISLPSTSLGNLTAYDAATGLASTITFGSGTIKSNAWMDTNYNWANSVFEASAMASLYASVAAVAATINHLMIEAASSSSVLPIIAITGAASATSGTKPFSISFTCSPGGGVPPYTYSWEFGDGATSNQQNPSHVYNSAGTFKATVTVTDSASNTKQWTETITVIEPSGAGTIGAEVISALVVTIAAVSAIPLLILRRRKKG